MSLFVTHPEKKRKRKTIRARSTVFFNCGNRQKIQQLQRELMRLSDVTCTAKGTEYSNVINEFRLKLFDGNFVVIEYF